MDERRLLALETKLKVRLPDFGHLRQMVAELWQINAPACSVEFDFHVTDSTTHADVSGATVTVTNGSGATVATLTTDSGGLATALLTGIDSYSATVSKTLYVTQTVSLSVPACGGASAVAVSLVEQTCTYNFTVTGCFGQPIPKATIAVTGLSPVTTNSSGLASITLTSSGSKSYTVSAARMDDVTGTIDGPPSCGTSAVAISMSNADVLTWICSHLCGLPVLWDLTVTQSGGGGSTAISYNAGTATWTGTSTGGTRYSWNGTSTLTVNSSSVSYGAAGSTCIASDGSTSLSLGFLGTGITWTITE